MQATDLVSIPALIDYDAPTTAALVWWDLHMVSERKLEIAWAKHGLPMGILPTGQRDLTALLDVARAVARKIASVTVDVDGNEVSHSVRKLAAGQGVVIVRDVASTEDVDKDCTVLRIKFARFCAGYAPDATGLVIDGSMAYDWADHIREAYDTARDLIKSTALSTMMSVRVAERLLHASKLKPTGGFLYVPREHVRTLGRVKRALEEVGCFVSGAPIATAGDITRDLLRTLEEESKILIQNMEKGLIESDIGPRACQGKARECDEYLTRLEEYEALLGTSLDTIKSRIAALSGNYTAAALDALAALG